MSEDIDDQNLYHYDFTTASEWEIFIARLVEIMHEWKVSVSSSLPLKPTQLFTSNWGNKTEQVSFAGIDFNLTRYYLKIDEEETNLNMLDNTSEEMRLQALRDVMSMENDFIPIVFDSNSCHPHVLTRWYGLRDFIVLTPASGILSTIKGKIEILLSSLCIAINDSNCEIPVFIQVLEPWQNFFLGLCEGQGVRADFEMIHLRKIPPHCKHLTGLLNIFKSKIGTSPLLEPVVISARFSYTLRDWTSFAWTQEPPDLEFLQGEVGVAELGTLPFGAIFDPISEMTLYTSWHNVRESVVVDSESYSDFDPLQAPEWAVSITMTDKPACLLSEYFSEFVHLCNCNKSMHELLGDLLQTQQSGQNLISPLSVLTESKVPTISKVIGRTKGSVSKETREGPIASDLLMPILYFLFPDADDDNKSPYPEYVYFGVGKEGKSSQDFITQMKSAPVDSLVWRLAVVMAHAVHTLGGVKAASHLWFEFCQELRFRWERAITIPGVAPGFPDAKTCLLNQKLQMLNCCVDRKNVRENNMLETTMEEVQSDSDDDEEFFDCSTDREDSPDRFSDPSEKTFKARPKPKHSLWNKPVGRKSRHGNIRLINTGEYLYIPVTQEPIPKTEDQLEEDAQVLLQLGTDAQGSELRARMMSASLLSDMESFKAANPGAVLEDFIRWYSPRDWVEEKELDEFGQHKGHLSLRMQIPGNTWLEVWSAAKPVPARRQKRLFDDTREAEKVLHNLDARRPSDVIQLLLPTLSHAAVTRLAQQAAPVELPGLEGAVKHIASKAETLSRAPSVDVKRYQELCNEIASAETLIAQVVSLEHKLCPGTAQTQEMRGFLADLVTKPEAVVPGGSRSNIANRIKAMFAEAHKVAQMILDVDPNASVSESWSPVTTSVFPAASEREFILRAYAPRPAPTSMNLPHRLSVRVCKDEIKMAGCFSQDTTFQ